MSADLDFYQQQVASRRSDIPWLLHLQQQALDELNLKGFPGKHLEDWKYTRTDALLAHPFASGVKGEVDTRMTRPGQAMPVGHPLAFINGTLIGYQALQAHLPTGAIVLPLHQALHEHADKIEPYLGHILHQQHGFHALNTAMLQEGLFIYLPKGVRLSTPLLLSYWQDKDIHAVHTRNLVLLEEGSELHLIEDFQGDKAACYFTNTITEVNLAPRAALTHYKIQREGTRAYHMGHLAVKQAAGSELNSHSFSMGGAWMRSDISIDLQAPHAVCTMNGVYMPHDKQHMDHHTLVNHIAPDCKSAQDYRGVLNGQARAVFNGRVVVVKDAQHSEARQQNKNLLLSANTEIDTKPQLEIYADDVTCSHGATVGQLDEEALFYLATRGIDRALASQYLVQAFVAEQLRGLTDPTLADWIGTLLKQKHAG